MSGVVVLALSVALPASADEDALRRAATRFRQAASDVVSIERLARQQRGKARSPQRRIAEAQLLMGVKDWERATDVLHEVVERHKGKPMVVADASNLLAECYFASGQMLSARRVLEGVVERAQEPAFKRLFDDAVVRLVDIALRLKQPDRLDAVFARMPATAGSSRLAYARGKGLYAQGKLREADAALARVATRSRYAHQARYLRGVVALAEAGGDPATTPAPGATSGTTAAPAATKTAAVSTAARPDRYGRAVAAFRSVTQLQAGSAEQRHVVDLAWLAIGRLLYETNQWPAAIQAYQQVRRGSPEFATMLYEVAWVYVRLGDMPRAQRALEVLSITAPDSDDRADASLLRGDLLLRAGHFSKSLKAYEGVRKTFEPMRTRMAAFLRTHRDPGVFFDSLTRVELELFEGLAGLPKQLLEWVREGDDGRTAFSIIDDVAASRRLIRQSNEIIERLNAVLLSPNRIRALPDLQRAAERGLGLANSIAVGRMELGRGMVEVEEDELSAALAGARRQRRRLEARLRVVPVSAADFTKRQRDAERQWNRASQAIQRLELEMDQMQAVINGLERMVRDRRSPAVRDPRRAAGYQAELRQQRQLLARFRSQVDGLRKMSAAGKMQVGFGDSRFVRDASVRRNYRRLLWREVQLARRGGGGTDLARYAERVAASLSEADRADDRIERALAAVERAVDLKAGELRRQVAIETRNIARYGLLLGRLDRESRMVVGEVAMRNFDRVRERLRAIVMRADVGITEQAWEVREEQIMRVRRLRIERSREERRLEEELDEVLGERPPPAEGK